MPELVVHRVISADDATAIVGTYATDRAANLPRVGVQPLRLIEDGETIGIVTRLPTRELTELRRAVIGLPMSEVARMSGRMKGSGRTFGWAPKRVVTKRESCHDNTIRWQAPGSAQVLADLSGFLSAQFQQLMPARAVADNVVLSAVHPDWRMVPGGLWTSGVVNRSTHLPYHRDALNFPTWSAMPTLRWGMTGGHLHLPEYDIVWPCRDGEVTWFCGRELVHGVTPLRYSHARGYRYSIVYYALRGMKDCRSYAEETAEAAVRRTAREKLITEQTRTRLEEVGR